MPPPSQGHRQDPYSILWGHIYISNALQRQMEAPHHPPPRWRVSEYMPPYFAQGRRTRWQHQLHPEEGYHLCSSGFSLCLDNLLLLFLLGFLHQELGSLCLLLGLGGKSQEHQIRTVGNTHFMGPIPPTPMAAPFLTVHPLEAHKPPRPSVTRLWDPTQN